MRSHRRTLIPILIAGLLLPLVLTTPAASAPDGAAGTERQASAVPSEPQRVRWRVRLDGDYSLHSPGVGADGTVYVAMAHGQLYAVNPATGRVDWVFQAGLGGGIHGPVSVGLDGTIYVAAMVPSGTGNSGAIFAINPDGTLRWTFEAGNFIIAGPNVGPDGNVYAVARLGGIGLFSLTPEGVRRFATGVFYERGSIGQEIGFGPNRLYFAFDMYGLALPPRLFAYDLGGRLVFERPDAVGQNAQPATGPNGNVVYPSFPTSQGHSLTAFNPNGALQWHFYEFPGSDQTPADIGPDNTAYSSRNLNTLLALNPDGGVRWRYVDPGIIFEPAVTPTGSLIFAPGRVTYGEPGWFLGVSPAGQPLWRVDLPDEPGLDPYGQLVSSSRPVFSRNADTAYAVTDVLGDRAPNDFAYLYAIDVTTGGGPPPPPPPPPPGGPAAPSGLSATPAAGRVDLRWTDNAGNESGFRIERCTGRSCTNFGVVGQVAANVTTYASTGLTVNTRYRYRVNAWNPSGTSSYSNVVAAKTPR